MSVTSKTHLESQTNVWSLTNHLTSRQLTDLKNFVFSDFSSNRDLHINEVLSENKLFRGRSTSIDNNCLLDTIFQQIAYISYEDDISDFVDFVREKIGKTKNEQLSINDEEEGVQILSAVQSYLSEKTKLQCHFDITVLLADNDGEIGCVDMQPMMNILQSSENVIPLRMIVVNYNHYEPIFKKGEEDSSKQELEDQSHLKVIESHSSAPLDPLIEEWAEVLKRGVHPMNGGGYLANLANFKDRLGIPEAEEGEGHNNEHLLKIERTVKKIIQLLKKQPDLQQINQYVHTIRDHAYELFIDPEKSVLACIQSPFYIFMLNQLKFREELGKITGKDSSKEALAKRILDGATLGKVTEEKESLLRDYPGQKEIISQLAEAAEGLFLEAINTAQQEILDYKERPEVKICYEWFLGFPHLETKYQMLRQGNYASLADIPTGNETSEKIYYPSYIPRLSALIVACQNLQKNDFSIENFEKYFLPQRKYRHFQETLVPLSFFLEVIDNILLWPEENEPSDAEWQFLRQAIMYLMAIANKNFPGNIRISYEYLSISEDKIKNEDILKDKKNASTERRRIAWRYIYHSRIPWKALRAIGNLTHRSGGVSDQDAGANDRLLRAAIVDFVRDLPQVREAMCALIEFELTEFDSVSKAFIAPAKSHYREINLLGNFVENRAHLKECLETLGHWDNRQLRADDYLNPKIQCAILRTIQLQGEVSKNIRRTGVLGEDLVWKLFEEIRDILSHSERVQSEGRLKKLLEISENHTILKEMVNDFRNIREFLQERFLSLNACKTWDDLRLDSNLAQKKTFLDLPGLESFYIFLTNKISAEIKVSLLSSSESDQAKSCRSEISSIVNRFLKRQFEPTKYKGDVEQLPLTNNQKKEVENGIKLLISPNAAANDAEGAKHSMLKTSIRIVNDMLQNKKRSYPGDILKSLKDILISLTNLKVKNFIESEGFRHLVATAKSVFQNLKQICKQKCLPIDQLIEENLTNLTENGEEYSKRKEERLFSILNKISIDLSDLDVESRCTRLIKNMQLGMSPNRLEIKLHRLGIKGDGEKIWAEARQCCLAKKKKVPSEDSAQDETLELKQILRLIVKIQNRISRLDQLMIHQTSGSIMQDPLLLLACQYLISDFRSAASSLESSLELFKYTYCPTWDLEFIQDIQRDLLFFIERGNDILHAHDISEPGTMTPHGRMFFAQQNVGMLIYSFSVGENRDILIPPLFSKLEKLKNFALNEAFLRNK